MGHDRLFLMSSEKMKDVQCRNEELEYLERQVESMSCTKGGIAISRLMGDALQVEAMSDLPSGSSICSQHGRWKLKLKKDGERTCIVLCLFSF